MNRNKGFVRTLITSAILFSRFGLALDEVEGEEVLPDKYFYISILNTEKVIADYQKRKGYPLPSLHCLKADRAKEVCIDKGYQRVTDFTETSYTGAVPAYFDRYINYSDYGFAFPMPSLEDASFHLFAHDRFSSIKCATDRPEEILDDDEYQAIMDNKLYQVNRRRLNIQEKEDQELLSDEEIPIAPKKAEKAKDRDCCNCSVQ